MLKKYRKNLVKLSVSLLCIYVIYVFVTSVVAFSFHKYDPEPIDLMPYYGDALSQDRVALLEDRMESGLARLHLIENVEHTLDIAYYTLHSGIARDIFFAAIVDAADRGVQVRLLLDGIFHNLNGSSRKIVYAFHIHPNIELQYYEPLDLLWPWTWNNRLHDKIIIADNELAMIGGRNIGDKYFMPGDEDTATNDRDVVIINSAPDQLPDSVIYQMVQYYDELWNHDYSREAVIKLKRGQPRKAQEKLEEFRRYMVELRQQRPDFFEQDINWLEQSVPTRNVTFIHNPIQRMNKEPFVWNTVAGFINHAEDSVLIQSPYVIPTKNMLDHIDWDNLSASQIEIVTNSLASSPNLLAFSGYIRHRESLVRSGFDLYEFQSQHQSLHAKTYVFDERISMIGSMNFDSRSAYLSTESMVVIDSIPFANMVKAELDVVKNAESLSVASDGTYMPHSELEPQKVPLTKSMAVRALSLVTRFVDFLL